MKINIRAVRFVSKLFMLLSMSFGLILSMDNLSDQSGAGGNGSRYRASGQLEGYRATGPKLDLLPNFVLARCISMDADITEIARVCKRFRSIVPLLLKYRWAFLNNELQVSYMIPRIMNSLKLPEGFQPSLKDFGAVYKLLEVLLSQEEEAKSGYLAEFYEKLLSSHVLGSGTAKKVDPSNVSVLLDVDRAVQDKSLEKMWSGCYNPFGLIDNIDSPNKPARDACAREIREWLHDPENLSAIRQVTSLNLLRSPMICFPEELSLFENLEKIHIEQANMIELYLPALPKLRWLVVEGDPDRRPLIKADLSNCPDLDYLCLNWNKLESIDLSNLPNLRWLRLSQNELTSLDISHCEKLENLDIENNRLTEESVTIPDNLRQQLAHGMLSGIQGLENQRPQDQVLEDQELEQGNGCTIS